MKNKLNGSVNLLADAMRQVFNEGLESNREVMKADFADGLDGIKKDIATLEIHLNKRSDTTNENMQAQFAMQEKKITEQGTILSEQISKINS